MCNYCSNFPGFQHPFVNAHVVYLTGNLVHDFTTVVEVAGYGEGHLGHADGRAKPQPRAADLLTVDIQPGRPAVISPGQVEPLIELGPVFRVRVAIGFLAASIFYLPLELWAMKAQE